MVVKYADNVLKNFANALAVCCLIGAMTLRTGLGHGAGQCCRLRTTQRTCIGELQVIFTVIGAIPLFGQYPSYYFLLGALLVSLSVGMYGTKPEQSAAFYAACAEACREPTWLLQLRTSENAQRIKARCGEMCSIYTDCEATVSG